jgi:hypothetical protein
MEAFYFTFIVIALLVLCYRGWNYYQFKSSGDILFIGSYRNWPIIILWLLVGASWSFNLFISFNNGMVSSRIWFEQLSFWALIISTNLLTFAQKTKVTEGGILQNGYYRPWEEIMAWKWEDQNSSTMVLETIPKIRIFQKLATLKLRIDPKQKDSLELQLKKYVPLKP